MNELKKIIISLLIVGGLLIIVDLCVGFLGDKMMIKIPDFSGDFAKDNYRLNRCDEDIVIVGSSRAAHHYETSILRDSINNYTHQNYYVYNAGIDGQAVNSNSCAIESIMNRYQPKMIILEIGASELLDGGNVASDMELSAVHYRTNPIVKRYLDDISLREEIKMQSSMYRWNNKLLRMASSFMKGGDSLGYLPIYGEMKIIEKEDNEDNSKKHKNINEYSVSNLSRVFQISKEKQINLVVVSSPRFQPQDDNIVLAELCEQYSIPYIEMYNEDYYNERPELFKDAAHLNDNGAHIFTNMIFEKLKPYLI